MTDRTKDATLVERMKGRAKRAAGTVLGNDGLRKEGELHREKADALMAAAELAHAAELDEQDAALQHRTEELEAEHRRLAIDAAADARDELIEQEQEQTATDAERRQRVQEQAAEAAARAAADAANGQQARAAQEHAQETAEAQRIEAAADRARAEANALAAAARTIEES